MILGIYGSSGLGREIYGFASGTINKRNNRWDDIVFVDDTKPAGIIGEVKTLPFNDIRKIYSKSCIEIVIAQGEPKYREMLGDKVECAGFSLATLIHPNAPIGPKVSIGSGVIINSDKVTISPHVVINKNVLIQPFVAIGHDTVIGCNGVISAFSAIAGNCIIGKNVYIGMHAAIKEKTSVGNNAIIGMGAMVTRSVPDNYTVFNSIAKMVEHDPGTLVFNN